MNLKKRILWITRFLVLSCFLLFISSCKKKATELSALPFYKDPFFTPVWMSANDASLDTFHTIADFSLQNQFGATITREMLYGKILVVDFFFTTCPGICPKMTDNMNVVQENFLNDTNVILLSFSVTPEIDSVQALAAYAKTKNVVPGKWHLLTGSRKLIYDLGRFSFFVEEDLGIQKTEDDFLHTENFILVDQQMHLRGIFNGLNTSSVQQLITDIHNLEKETIQF